MLALVFVLIGLVLLSINQLTGTAGRVRIVTRYIPRDMDAWFKDPENQPMYMYKDAVFGENVRK